MKPVVPLVLLATAALAGSLVAIGRPGDDVPVLDRVGADLLAPAATPVRATTRLAPGGVGPAAAPTIDEVGDPDSFGRTVNWLGVLQGSVQLADTCPPATPNTGCQVLSPVRGAITPFTFNDLDAITLPGKSAKTLLCYWFSPFLSVRYANPTAAPVIARLTYQPTLTIESPVLDDPALVDPTTGAPFGGRLTTGMTASERFEVPLDAGVTLNERTRDSAVCIAGFLTRRSLVELYGLTDTQAREVFKQPITIRLNVTGSAQHVADATLVYGLRVVGD